jgi:hypothetical protein
MFPERAPSLNPPSGLAERTGRIFIVMASQRLIYR